MISDLNHMCLHEYICVLDPIYELFAPITVRNRRSQKWQLGTPKGMVHSLRITCIHWVYCFVPVLFDRSTLISISSFWPRSQRDGRTKDVVQVLIASTYNYLRDTCLIFDICLDDHYFSVCLAPSWNHDISHPCSAQPSISLAYSVLILLVISCYFCCLLLLFTFTITTITIISLLPLIFCCK